jgi:hypothetical protein
LKVSRDSHISFILKNKLYIYGGNSNLECMLVSQNINILEIDLKQMKNENKIFYSEMPKNIKGYNCFANELGEVYLIGYTESESIMGKINMEKNEILKVKEKSFDLHIKLNTFQSMSEFNDDYYFYGGKFPHQQNNFLICYSSVKLCCFHSFDVNFIFL